MQTCNCWMDKYWCNIGYCGKNINEPNTIYKHVSSKPPFTEFSYWEALGQVVKQEELIRNLKTTTVILPK